MSSAKPTLSVYVPNYNHAQYLPEALEGIFSQSWAPDEVIVIDDGSTDNSIEVLQRYVRKFPTLRLLRSETNRGVVHAMNWALREVRGDYLCATSADDRILPGFFEKCMSLLAEYPQAGLCCSDPVFFESSAEDVKVVPKGWGTVPAYYPPADFAKVIRGGYIDGHATIAKRTACIEAGGYIEELRWHCDWLLWMTVAFRHGVCHVPEPLSAMRVAATTYSSAGKRREEEQRDVLRALLRRLKSPELSPLLPLFTQSGVLEHFGEDLVRLIRDEPSLLN